MTPVIHSTRLGWATGRLDRSRVRVYRALERIRCADCGGYIAKGSRFVRRTRYGATGRELHQPTPICRACYPFD